MYRYEDTSLPFEARAADLVGRLTLEEKALQLSHDAPAIPRMGIRAWNWWNEASHGVMPAVLQEFREATSFPTCLAMSQTWNPELIEEVTTAISDEIRALRNMIGKELDYWCPTVNMGRDPRWGRNDEGFGEDPYLAGKLAAAYVRGLQGKDSKYLKAISTPKHFAANNSEYNRCNGSSNMDEATLREYYLPVFERCVREGGAYSIMTSYNRVNGVPSSANHHLLKDILREEWGFKGYIVSDDGAVGDVGPNTSLMFGMLRGQFYGKTMPEASALCVNAGTDLCTGIEHDLYLMEAVRQGLTTEDMLDRALIRAFTARFMLGEFDNPRPFAEIGEKELCCEANAALARRTATESLTLLRNENGILPIDERSVRTIAIIGPNAIYRQMGSYSIGGNPHMDSDTRVSIPPLRGIRAEAEKRGIEIVYKKGWNRAEHKFERPKPTAVLERAARDAGMTPDEYLKERVPEGEREFRHSKFKAFAELMRRPLVEPRHPVVDPDLGRTDEELMAEALEAAAKADLVVVIAGTDPSVTREGADRQSLNLPYDQDVKIREILSANPKTVVVCVVSGPVTGDFLGEVPGLLCATYAGESQGAAIADVLFGAACPSGRLSETWFFNETDLPHISEYGIRPFDSATEMGRTYLYYLGKVRFPFGYGLSYTKFEHSNFALNRSEFEANDTITASVDVKNVGEHAGSDVIELYFRKLSLYDNKPLKQLAGFCKVFLEPGETKTVTLNVPVHELKYWNSWRARFEVEPGDYALWIGESSDEDSILARTEIKVSGRWHAPLSAVTLLSGKSLFKAGEEAEIVLGATLEDATHLDASALPFEFTSSDDTVARIEDGSIRALRPGAVKLTASLTLNGVTRTDSIGVCVIE